MLLQTEARNVDSSTALQTGRAQIKTSAKIFDFFANQTYSNKPRAICRELVANAVDSHVMAGKAGIPVEVWLPNLVDPVFRVRDQGLGMSHEFVMGPFMTYADGSTKDGSNIAIGGFGIGSKSPFAYVDQFTLKSIFDGTESVYSVFKAEDGVPEIALLAQRTTDEPNGVEVSFPVEVADFKSFEEAAFEALKYFEPLPLIRNASEGRFNPPKYISRGKMWRMREVGGDLQVIMGGVMYPVEANNLTYKFKDDMARKMLRYGLDIVVPIGTCSVALSREALSYDDKTIEALQKACLDVVDEVAKSFETMFDQYGSLWEASAALFKEAHPHGKSHYGGISTRANFLIEHAKYKGKDLKLALEFAIPPMGTAIWEIEPKRNRRSSSCPVPKWTFAQHERHISPGEFEHVIIDDLPRNPKSRTISKIRYFVDEDLDQDSKVLIVRAQDESVKTKAILKALGNPPASMVTMTSKLADPPANAVIASTGKAYVRPRIRMLTYDGSSHSRWNTRFAVNSDGYWTNLTPASYGKEGVREIEYANQPISGIFVCMNSFTPPADFYSKMKTGLVLFDELHFINIGDKGKLDPNAWEDFEDVFQKRLKDAMAQYPETGHRLAVEDSMHERLQRLFSSNHFQARKRTAFAKLEALFRSYIEPLDSQQRKLRSFVSVKLPRGIDPEQLFEDFKKESPKAYRMLQLMDYRIEESIDKTLLEENI